MHALKWETCIRRSLQTSVHREDPMDAKPRAGFGCQHVRQGSGAPAGPGGATVSWCMHASPAGILQASYCFWVRNLSVHTTDLISWTAYRPHVLPWVKLMFWVEGLWIFVVHAASCLQHSVLVCRQPVNAFHFNLAKWDKSLVLVRSIKQALEIITGLLYGRSCKAHMQGFSSVHQAGWHMKWRKKETQRKQDGATPRGKMEVIYWKNHSHRWSLFPRLWEPPWPSCAGDWRLPPLY